MLVHKLPKGNDLPLLQNYRPSRHVYNNVSSRRTDLKKADLLQKKWAKQNPWHCYQHLFKDVINTQLHACKIHGFLAVCLFRSNNMISNTKVFLLKRYLKIHIYPKKKMEADFNTCMLSGPVMQVFPKLIKGWSIHHHKSSCRKHKFMQKACRLVT